MVHLGCPPLSFLRAFVRRLRTVNFQQPPPSYAGTGIRLFILQNRCLFLFYLHFIYVLVGKVFTLGFLQFPSALAIFKGCYQIKGQASASKFSIKDVHDSQEIYKRIPLWIKVSFSSSFPVIPWCPQTRCTSICCLCPPRSLSAPSSFARYDIALFFSLFDSVALFPLSSFANVSELLIYVLFQDIVVTALKSTEVFYPQDALQQGDRYVRILLIVTSASYGVCSLSCPKS